MKAESVQLEHGNRVRRSRLDCKEPQSEYGNFHSHPISIFRRLEDLECQMVSYEITYL